MDAAAILREPATRDRQTILTDEYFMQDAIRQAVKAYEADEVPVHRRFEQCGGLAIVEHTEAGLDPGLDRKPPQQRLGEGVDGLDVEPARRLQHPRVPGA